MSLSFDQQSALDLHNAARAAVGVGQLVWNTSLQADAQSWATQLSSMGTLQHNPSSGQGENLASGPPGDDAIKRATEEWLNEKAAYLNNHGGGFTQETGHYTQCVWHGTTDIGIGESNGYVVARYSPAGNVNGDVAYPQDSNGNPTNAAGGGGAGGDGSSGTPTYPDGLLLLNGYDANGNGHSAVGFYRSMAPSMNGVQPDAVASYPGIITWEGANQNIPFADGNVFSWVINGNAQAQQYGAMVGTANNNFQGFKVYKDDQRVVYEKDGVAYHTIYWVV